MKPFNLEEALAGKAVVTSKNVEAKLVYHYEDQKSLLFILGSDQSGWLPIWFSYDGFGQGEQLHMKSEKKKLYIGVSKDGDATHSTSDAHVYRSHLCQVENDKWQIVEVEIEV